jgi:hemerythrin-like domain-containing protein/AcrR family transcriptional regulator
MMAQKLGTDVRKKQIAQAALSLVSSQGLKGLSVAGIASRVGLVPSAIYRHFKNKEQVIDAILDLIRERLLANVKVVTEETGDALERLRRLLMLHIQLIRENQGIMRVVFSEEVMNGPLERKTRVHAMVETYLEAVAEIVRQGQEEGVCQRDLEASSVSVAFLGMIQQAAIIWHLSAGKFDLTGHAERAWEIFLRGISPQKHNDHPWVNPGRMATITATEILRHEHKIILQVLDAVRHEAQAIGDTGKLSLEKLDKILDFFQVFVDCCHHGKEEKYLCPTMEKCGIPADKGPIAVMLQEHAGGRNTVKAIAEALVRARQSDAAATEAVAVNLAFLVEHLGSHIDKENEVLFPMADKVFAPEDQQALVASFEKHEAEEMGAGMHEKYRRLVHELAQD